MCNCKRPSGWPMCHCAGCHRWFGGVGAFTIHQTTEGGLTCHDPATRGLVAVRTADDGTELWGQPGRRDPAAIARLRAREEHPREDAPSGPLALDRSPEEARGV